MRVRERRCVYKIWRLHYPLIEMKQSITDILTQFQKGQITMEEAADRLLTEKMRDGAGREKSNQRMKDLCSALQQERDPAKVRQIKDRLTHEFYYGDKVL